VIPFGIVNGRKWFRNQTKFFVVFVLAILAVDHGTKPDKIEEVVM